MIESFLGLLRKRRRVDGDSETTTPSPTNSNATRHTTTRLESESQSPSPHPYSMLNDDECLLQMQINDSDSDLVQLRGPNSRQLAIIDRPFNLNERFVGVLDQLDARVEKFRKDAMGLQEKRDFLLMSIDLIKTNDLLQGMNEAEREEISCYIQRVNSRLSTVELNVRTVRDHSQEDSLSQINMLIDMMITLGDPVLSRQRCQQYLNACSSSDGSNNMGSFAEHGIDQDVIVDKKFECALLGCTLDDQKNVKKRLQALMGYLNKQLVRD